MEPEAKNRRMLMTGMVLAAIALIFVSAVALDRIFPTKATNEISGAPGIVGFVPVEIKSQLINIDAKSPSEFVLFSDKPEQFALTSLRLTGEVVGKGRVEILLDNGLGQELMIYSNIKDKQGNEITGMAVGDTGNTLPSDIKTDNVAPESAWIKITDAVEGLDESPSEEVGTDKTTSEGMFSDECVKTCYMNMKMRQGLYYTLKIKMDKGTEVKINEIKYTLEV